MALRHPISRHKCRIPTNLGVACDALKRLLAHTVNEDGPKIPLTWMSYDRDVNITLVTEGFRVDKWISAPVLAGLLDKLD